MTVVIVRRFQAVQEERYERHKEQMKHLARSRYSWLPISILLLYVMIDLVQSQPVLNWTWLSGDSVGNQVGVFDVQGVPSPLNQPGARKNGFMAWKDPQNPLELYIFNGDVMQSFPDNTTGKHDQHAGFE